MPGEHHLSRHSCENYNSLLALKAVILLAVLSQKHYIFAEYLTGKGGFSGLERWGNCCRKRSRAVYSGNHEDRCRPHAHSAIDGMAYDYLYSRTPTRCFSIHAQSYSTPSPAPLGTLTQPSLSTACNSS